MTRKTTNGRYSFEGNVSTMDTVSKNGSDFIKVDDIVNGIVFQGRRVPPYFLVYYSIKPIDITWKYNTSLKEEECNGKWEDCYLVTDGNVCINGHLLCLPHNHVVDWRIRANKDEEFELLETEGKVGKEMGKEQERELKESITKIKNINNL